MVMRILPGNCRIAMFGMGGFRNLPAANRDRIMADFGLSNSLLVQYIDWMKVNPGGSLCKSFFRGESVSKIIMHRSP
jgi:ABC-type dipeptide/oligopeptide/nickel transport system permease component